MNRRTVLVTGGSGFIGTNLIETLKEQGNGVVNVSRTTPRNTEHGQYFRHVDVLDVESLMHTMEEFAPEIVVHLAAETGYGKEQNRLAYEVNTEGTTNVIKAASACSAVNRVVFASSNVVDRDVPDSENSNSSNRFLYGDSKRAAEELIARNTTMQCAWCIVRPCYVWGPWFDAPFKDFFHSIERGFYLHPGRVAVRKRIGYVGNVVHQLCALMTADATLIHRKTLYLADYEPITVHLWAEMISDELGVRHPWTAPDVMISVAAKFGDALRVLGCESFPLTSHRLLNMRYEACDIPIESIKAIAGPLPFTVQQGIQNTVAWMRREGLIRQHD